MYLDLRTISKDLVNIMSKKIENQKHLIKFRSFNKTQDSESLLNIYNRAFLVNPDPFQRMNMNDLNDLEDRVIFMTSYVGKDVGFIWFTLDEEDGNKMATISIVAVLPSKQRRGIATAMALHSYDFLKKNDIYHLGCIIGEKNKEIQNFVKFIGFKKFGEEILEY